jgi:hypothetical protein
LSEFGRSEPVETGMTRRTNPVAFLALVAFLGCTAGASGLIPASCCSSRKVCPGSSCDSTAAKLSLKSDTILAVAPAPVPQIRLSVGFARIMAAADVLTGLPPAFQRPMRN